MAMFEGYERRIAQVSAFLAAHGIESLEAAEKICLDQDVDVRQIVKSIQPISFENAGWAYLIGAAVAIKQQQRVAADQFLRFRERPVEDGRRPLAARHA